MACLGELVLPLTLTFPPLSTQLSFSIGGGEVCTIQDRACEG
jgi:hypothetical protein